MKRLLVATLASGIFIQPVFVSAQSAPSPAAVSVTRQGEGPLMAAVRRDAARVAAGEELFAARPSAPPQADRRHWISRHPALFGALVGAGVGLAATRSMDNELICNTGSDEDCLIYNNSRYAASAGIFAGVGALAGWMVGLARR